MKIILFLLGVLVSLIGALPILNEYGIKINFLDFIPLGGMIYNVIIIVLGLLVIYFGIKGKSKKIKKNE